MWRLAPRLLSPRAARRLKLASDQELITGQPPMIDFDAPSSTYRISVDVDIVPAGMGSEQACGLVVAALESAHTLVRAVRVNQCSRRIESDGFSGFPLLGSSGCVELDSGLRKQRHGPASAASYSAHRRGSRRERERRCGRDELSVASRERRSNEYGTIGLPATWSRDKMRAGTKPAEGNERPCEQRRRAGRTGPTPNAPGCHCAHDWKRRYLLERGDIRYDCTECGRELIRYEYQLDCGDRGSKGELCAWPECVTVPRSDSQREKDRRRRRRWTTPPEPGDGD